MSATSGSAWLKLRNWPRFVVDYMSANDAGRVYTLRNGIELERDAASAAISFWRNKTWATRSLLRTPAQTTG